MCNSELKPHVHAQQIKAWADGHTIEYWCRFSNQWTVEVDPAWALDAKYRIKPEQSDFEKYGVEVGDAWSMKSVTWGYFVVKKIRHIFTDYSPFRRGCDRSAVQRVKHSFVPSWRSR